MPWSMVRGWAVVSVALNLEAAFLFATYPPGLNACPDLDFSCFQLATPSLWWELIAALGCLPLLPVVRPRFAPVSLAGASFLLALTGGLFFAFEFVGALPLLCFGSLIGVASTLVLARQVSALRLRQGSLVMGVTWLLAACLLLLDTAYSWGYSHAYTECLNSVCMSYSPYLWPYAQFTAVALAASAGVAILPQVHPWLWGAGALGGALAVAGVLWLLGLNLVTNMLPMGFLTVFGFLFLLAASVGYYEAWRGRRSISLAILGGSPPEAH